MVQPLTGQDAFFIYGESPEQHQHAMAFLLLDPSTAPEGRFSVEKIIEKMQTDIQTVPEYRMKLADVPLTLSPPALVDDPNFNVRNHIKHIAVPPPGNMRQVCGLINDISSQQLRRDRPLWEVWFISGIEGGLVGMVNKTHHCMTDGVKGAQLMAEQFDFEPDPPPKEDAPLEPWHPRESAFLDVTSATWRKQLRERRGIGEMIGKTYKAFAKRRKVSKETPEVSKSVPNLFPQAPRLKFNGEITSDRVVAIGDVPLADVKAIKDHFGCKLNDVVLAACALAFRNYLIETNDLPDDDLVIAVPVSLKLRDESAAGDSNANGSMMVKVPVDETDVSKLIARVHENTLAAKHIFENSYEDLMNGYVSMLPPPMANMMLKTLFGKAAGRYMPTPTNATVSNIPGPPIELYMLGARLVGMYPIGPVIMMQGINITLMSSKDSLNYSVHACKKSIADVWPLANDMETAFADMLAATREKPKTKKAAAKPAKRAAASKAKKAKKPKEAKKPKKKAAKLKKPVKKKVSKAGK